MPVNNSDSGIPEYECDECGTKTQEVYYVEDYESETRARQILCPECYSGFIEDGTIVLVPNWNRSRLI